ncbi:aminotransferase class V-fold PLP-dependent enzyme [Anaeromyxobacter diazotrophicus]|uniref:Aminotransferase n=1 Tax=Anaeromyxobacter diazotrophicus TaxID=2590199 RepID=A0A7I9VI71_9BACT|nr:aminotransferase class V-fold PLP-dependent enzyme [Anaeromyxobacter diazotrophicus]GEJ56055.1 aminotransferase [Anaeromyxobacter diazotrophicus]
MSDAAPAPRLGDRALFPDLTLPAYLNHAGISPPSRPVQRAVAEQLQAYAGRGGEAVTGMLAMRARLRQRLARVTGARPEDLALTSGATHGIQAVALSFPWRRGDRLVLFEGEFPANVTPWQRAAALFGLEVRFVPLARFEAGDGEGLAAFEAELRRGARLAAVSAVQFSSGRAMPLRELGALCARHGAELFVDAIQALGAVPLDLPALGVDYLACGAHKWLMGAEGAGFLYVRPERLAALRPALAGWLSHEEAFSFLVEPGQLRYDRPIRREASLFEAGSASALSQAALDASLGLILELGPAAIHAHVNRYLDRLEPLLAARGFASRRPRDPARRGPFLSAAPPPGHSPRQLREALLRAGVAVATPDGLVRFAPHWPNDADRELPAIEAALDAARG